MVARGHLAAQSVEPVTLDLGVVNSSPVLDAEIPYINQSDSQSLGKNPPHIHRTGAARCRLAYILFLLDGAGLYLLTGSYNSLWFLGSCWPGEPALGWGPGLEATEWMVSFSCFCPHWGQEQVSLGLVGQQWRAAKPGGLRQQFGLPQQRTSHKRGRLGKGSSWRTSLQHMGVELQLQRRTPNRATVIQLSCYLSLWLYSHEPTAWGRCQDVSNGCLSCKSKIWMSFLPAWAQDQNKRGQRAASHLPAGQRPQWLEGHGSETIHLSTLCQGYILKGLP